MRKMSTLFKKDPNDLGRVINEINPENEWAFTDGIPTRKFDGTSCAIIGGVLYKRYDAKKNKKGIKKPIPLGAIPCQEADEKSGHHPHWIKCERDDNSNKYHFIGFDSMVQVVEDGTYELCGKKVQGNPERIQGHILIRHGIHKLSLKDDSFEYIKQYLTDNDIEGIVFHHRLDDRMCKIRKSDFGIKR
jgi:hypothetical protein